jgi:hypothetical protein
MPVVSPAQYNLDWNTQVLPSPGFGGAANQPGSWFQMAHPISFPLLDLTGNFRGAWLTKWFPGGYASGHNNFTGNTREFKALLDDFYQSVPYNWILLQRLGPGTYDIYTYAGATLDPTPGEFTIGVGVSKSGFGRPALEIRTIRTPMPGNVFIEGITHTKHRVKLQGRETVQILVRSATSHALISGIQIVIID